MSGGSLSSAPSVWRRWGSVPGAGGGQCLEQLGVSARSRWGSVLGGDGGSVLERVEGGSVPGAQAPMGLTPGARQTWTTGMTRDKAVVGSGPSCPLAQPTCWFGGPHRPGKAAGLVFFLQEEVQGRRLESNWHPLGGWQWVSPPGSSWATLPCLGKKDSQHLSCLPGPQ